MASNTLAYLYQLQGQNYSSLSNTNFKLAVVDDDSSGLTASQISNLESQGKMIFSYLAVGQAEPWRNNFNANAGYILGQDPLWGSYFVKFWDPAWQKLVIDRAVSMAKEGYGGVVLDVVDVYNYSNVYSADGGQAKARSDMISFISKISDAAKAVNPNFNIITNNGMDLVTTNGSASGTLNTAYLNKIDGINAESTFYLSDNSIPSWSSANLGYLKNFVNAGKVVFSIDYPSSESTQLAYIDKAIANGFIPFIGNTALSQIDSTNYQILDKLPASAYNSLLDNGSSAPSTPSAPTTPSTTQDHVVNGTSGADTINGYQTRDLVYSGAGNDVIHGNGGIDYIEGGDGDDIIYGDADGDFIFGGNGSDKLIGGAGNDGLTGGAGNDIFAFYKGAGNDWLNDFQGAGAVTGDIIQISSDIYSSVSQILSNISYSGGNAVIKLDGSNSVTLAGVSGGLTAADFQIINPTTGESVLSSPSTPTPPTEPTTPTVPTTPTTSGVKESTAPNGDHVLTGSSVADTINGLDVRDQIYGGAGNDVIHSNGGIDYIEGGDGNDILYGDAGGDFIFGGNGNDILIGGAGNDGLTGGVGADKFVFYKGAGNDWLNDFHTHTSAVAERDMIQISSDIYSSVSQILSHVTYTNGNAVISLDDNNSVTLAGVAKGALNASDFQIV